jgi:tetratricopeptide (TPR) repeat protein
MDKMLVRSSIPLIEGGVHALNQETDLKLAEDSIPTNIEMLEGMIIIDPENDTLHVYAAQAYYGLGYGFNEDNRPKRAVNFYRRGLKHGKQALAINGLNDIEKISIEELETRLAGMDEDDVPALFWTAGNWAKWIDQNRDASGLVQLPRATALMQRVLELDDTFYYGSAHIYFGVYYGGKAPMFGGDFKKSEYHFDKAREITDGNLLVVDLLQAQYLSRQKFDREDFHNRLTKIIEAPDDLYPELGLLNQIAKRKARMLLNKEEEWF